jgi:DNA-binding MarR family transcriptional regulator
MSGIAKRLEKSEFAVRGADDNDDRKTILQITPKGRQVVLEIRNFQETNIRDFVSCCEGDQMSEMLAMLKKMLELDNSDLLRPPRQR